MSETTLLSPPISFTRTRKWLRLPLAVRVLIGLSTLALPCMLPSQEISQLPLPRTLMRYPDSHGDQVVFVTSGNLWKVAKEGGDARRLTSHNGQDSFPRFSPDGNWIAFSSDMDGQADVYVMPANGGIPKRLTHRNGANMVITWTPDSKRVIFLSKREAWVPQMRRAFSVSVSGGQPEPLPLPNTGSVSFSPDGDQIAYANIFSGTETWKRYDGGRAPDIFVYDLKRKTNVQITDWKGNDSDPMWIGHKLYFLSDREVHRRVNLWVYDFVTKTTHQVTHFSDFDIDFPAAGDHAITFQQGGRLWLLDLPTERLKEVAVTVEDDAVRLHKRNISVERWIREADTDYGSSVSLSRNGLRAAFSARGDLFTVPAEHGPIRNLTRSSGADDDHPAWSPDGSLIAYTSDESGESQLYIRAAIGGPARLLTHFANGYLYRPVWSPDGKAIAIWDIRHRLWLINTDGSGSKQVAFNEFHVMHEVHEQDQTFSSDGKWLAFSTIRSTRLRALHFYEVATGKDTILSSPLESDFDPAFSEDGKYFYFASDRQPLSVMADHETNVVALKPSGLYVSTLDPRTVSPLGPQSDESSSPFPAQGRNGAGPDLPQSEGILERAVPLPVAHIDVGQLQAFGDVLFFDTQPPETLTSEWPERPEVHSFDLKTRSESLILSDQDSYSLSADGRRVLFKADGQWHIADAAPGIPNNHTLDLSDLRTTVSPREEWDEIFDSVWRLERDAFFSKAMNGNDWKAIHDHYSPLLPLVSSRADLTYLLGQMIAELSSSHTYVGDGDADSSVEPPANRLLGADLAVDSSSGRYRIAKILPGDDSRPELRSPLAMAALNVHGGDYLLAINGVELISTMDPDSLLIVSPKLADLEVADKPSGVRRHLLVQTISDDLPLREEDWIKRNRRTVDLLSGGRVGYMYLSDMMGTGMDQFLHQFYSQLDKKALIIDDRWNRGGNTDQYLLERLRRVLVGMVTNRDQVLHTQPDQVFLGPMVMLVNHFSASDGDVFPYYFRQYGLGEIVGTRPWGGVRGLRTFWPLIDGGYVTIPEIDFYDATSHWVLENHGIDPNVLVENEPQELQAGHDAQLEKAVELMLKQIDMYPRELPKAPAQMPAYPREGIVPPADVHP